MLPQLQSKLRPGSPKSIRSTISARHANFFRIYIHHKENSSAITLVQTAFITTILKQFNMQIGYDVSTPMDPNVKLHLAEDQGEKELKEIKGYQEIVGSLIYAALATRLNISFAVNALSRYNSKHYTSHLTAAKSVLQYLKSTANLRLHFRSRSSFNDQLTGYMDIDWANDCDDRKSHGGHVLRHSTEAVSWHSGNQE